MKVKTQSLTDPRPADVPVGWLIFNAPRPPYGHKDWQGYFRHGIFYAAIDPTQPEAARWVELNADYDCWLCQYVTAEEIMEFARQRLAQYGITDREFSFESARQSYLANKGYGEIDLEI